MLSIKNLSKRFGQQIILDKLDFEIKPGTSYAIIGRSGEGKSTLLHILGTLEKPDDGEVIIHDKKVNFQKSEWYRKHLIGFIFQNFNVLDDFSVIDNLKIAAMIRNQTISDDQIDTLLESYSLKDKKFHLARVLSGGEKQRLAIARACMHNPKIVLADEPTGSLDSQGALLIEELLLSLSKKHNVALVIVTHDLELAKKCDKVLHLKDGKLKEFI